MANTSETQTQTDNRPERCGNMHADLQSIKIRATVAADHLETVEALRAALRQVAGFAAAALAADDSMRYGRPADCEDCQTTAGCRCNSDNR